MCKGIYPAGINYEKALEYSKQVCGIDVRFYPNERTMQTMWAMHAETILEAMQYAYLITLYDDLTQFSIKPDNCDCVLPCGHCHGVSYHAPGCPENLE